MSRDYPIVLTASSAGEGSANHFHMLFKTKNDARAIGHVLASQGFFVMASNYITQNVLFMLERYTE